MLRFILTIIILKIGTNMMMDHTLPAMTENIVEEAPKFYVLGEKAGKYSQLYLKEAIENDAGYQFRLNVDSVELSVGDVHNINVLESDEISQLIEFNYINTYSSTSTYKVINNKIEPVSYRINSNMGTGIIVLFLIIPLMSSPDR